jgi:predicted transcriptional regulator
LPLAQKVDQLAARLDRSRGWIIKQALLLWIDQQERKDMQHSDVRDGVDGDAKAGHDNV